MMRWQATVAYDGTEFHGWQSQPSGLAIQDFLERRLGVLFGRPVRIHGAGRTDSGVHADAQVFHFDGEWPHGARALLQALRTGYPASIQVQAVANVEPDFHARFSAIGKRYRYQFFEGYAPPRDCRFYWSLGHYRLDLARMEQAARVLIGRHDFSAFTANPRDNRQESPIKDLRRLELRRDGPRLYLVAEADGFLYRMVRSIAGFLADVGNGKLQPADTLPILESRLRTNRVHTAPAGGLFLEQVVYPPPAAGYPLDRATLGQ
jgi:tRNA pseudouridine38-40 synthase